MSTTTQAGFMTFCRGSSPVPATKDTKFLICINRCEGNRISGKFRHLYIDRGIPFDSLWALIRSADQLMDRLKIPQAMTKQRSFRETGSRDAEIFSSPPALLDRPWLENCRGRHATLFLFVRYRQNSSWQGEVIWLEKQRTVSFRSVLELLYLIGEAAGDREEDRDD